MPERNSRRARRLSSSHTGQGNLGGTGHDSLPDFDQGPRLAVERLLVSRTPSPPSKRRKVGNGNFAPHRSVSKVSRARQLLEEKAELDWCDLFPIFGNMSNIANAEETEQQEKIIAHLREKQPPTRGLNERDRELVFPDRDEGTTLDDEYMRVLRAKTRLEHVHEATERWWFAGCELCFLATGRKVPGHNIKTCNRQPACEQARRILRWLESLRIPRQYPEGGGCSMCGHGWLPCKEVAIGLRRRAHIIEDGLCQNKPVVRRMMAALCAWDDQLLGKVLTKMTLEQDNVDITSEPSARRWFQGRLRICGRGEFWASNMVCVLDQILSAYDFHYSSEKVPAPAVNGMLDWENSALRWDNRREVEDWEKALEWLQGKCTFCAGRGYSEEDLGHTLRRCNRGGASQIGKGSSEMMYDEGFVPSNGCEYCRLPRDFCSRWAKREGGGWTRTSSSHCKHSEYLLCDGIVGFYTCGTPQYQSDIYDEVEEYCMSEEEGMPYYDEEAAASWLSQPLAVAGVEASQMVRQLSIWTHGLDAFMAGRTG
ncbi:hypothetical protein HIM_12177 [Hirsutella minnesotensis 3608]|uniref:Uncharacterized protein n=1 Tax=Hirsutella minnesotensis 3608 TaxID=1043627 RepID=A0A0F7ZQT7_9HYPO|nr:hypothetical protein HIM_12177 [Hirsutella minnesotensis 3608]